jgi:hypothetical protein
MIATATVPRETATSDGSSKPFGSMFRDRRLATRPP